MSTADFLGTAAAADDDDDMVASSDEEVNIGRGRADSEDEADGINLMHNSDSSEEESDEGSDAAREVAEGFIVDERDSGRKKKKKRRKEDGEGRKSKKRRKSSEDGDGGRISEDDLDLLEENTGLRLGGRREGEQKPKRLRRKRSASVEDDQPRPGALANIFDDDEDDQMGNEMEGFIEDDESEGDKSDDPESRAAAKQKAKLAKKKKATAGSGGFTAGFIEGLTDEQRQDVLEVFGNGMDFDWVTAEDDEEKEEQKLEDIFEPSEIASRMLTGDDDMIRTLDIPERLQIASAGIPINDSVAEDDEVVEAVTLKPFMDEDEIQGPAADYVAKRLSSRVNEAFFYRDNDDELPRLHSKFMDALRDVLTNINAQFVEVPFILANRPDICVHYDPEAEPNEQFIPLITDDELWRIDALSLKYRALAHRKRELLKVFKALNISDPKDTDYFEEIFQNDLTSVEEVADMHQWLAMRYPNEFRGLKNDREGLKEGEISTRYKRATKADAYEKLKYSHVSELAEKMAISATQLAQNFSSFDHRPDDPDTHPSVFALEFGESTASVLDAAKSILVHEIANTPGLKAQVRKAFERFAVVSVFPTEAGTDTITEMHPFNAFKYLRLKPAHLFKNGYQFLQILSAEASGLVTVSIEMSENGRREVFEKFSKFYVSDFSSEVVAAWNKLRVEVLEEALSKHLIPMAMTWWRNLIKEGQEEWVGNACVKVLDGRIGNAPYFKDDGVMTRGETPSVLALSHGKGDPKRDHIIATFVDQNGHMREHLKLDNLSQDPNVQDLDDRETFIELLTRRRPQVIVIGGFSPRTRDLMKNVEAIAAEVSSRIDRDEVDEADDGYLSAADRTRRAAFHCIYVHDDVARIYQNSKRATMEFPELSTLGRYCVALARYAQNPLLEYVALGPDLTAISVHPAQKFITREKLLHHFEQRLVSRVNSVGVDLNRAARDSYYAALLPYVAGLGPRKAAALIKAINAKPYNGTITSRSVLVNEFLLTTQIFYTSASFLRISQDDLQADLARDDDAQLEVLDDTRIHPEDYHFAQNIAKNALELDDEDLEYESSAIVQLRETNFKQLHQLNLEAYAAATLLTTNLQKIMTFKRIAIELEYPYGEQRVPFDLPTATEVFTMLTGETPETLTTGIIIPVRILRVRPDSSVLVKLESGIEGIIKPEERSDGELVRPQAGSTVQALVIGFQPSTFEVELSTRASNIQSGDSQRRSVAPDAYYDMRALDMERSGLAAKLSKANRKAGGTKRIINHPAFYNMSSGEAERALETQQRGDCIIRPSSKDDHLAVTWKVDTGVYQHIAVHEMDRKDEMSLGRKFKIGKFEYADLDELIVSHVRAMSRKIDELTSHDKYRGTADKTLSSLYVQLQANPNVPVYAFGLDSSPGKGGQFFVGFQTNVGDKPQIWPIKIVPGAFTLFGEEHGDVVALCNAFKIAYQNSLSDGGRLPGQATKGRTPQVNAGPTPNYFGGGTPGLNRGRGGGRTPSGYTPAAQYGASTQSRQGGYTPGHAPSTQPYLGAASPYHRR